jgi:hypothetical protein
MDLINNLIYASRNTTYSPELKPFVVWMMPILLKKPFRNTGVI